MVVCGLTTRGRPTQNRFWFPDSTSSLMGSVWSEWARRTFISSSGSVCDLSLQTADWICLFFTRLWIKEECTGHKMTLHTSAPYAVQSVWNHSVGDSGACRATGSWTAETAPRPEWVLRNRRYYTCTVIHVILRRKTEECVHLCLGTCLCAFLRSCNTWFMH